MMTQPGSDPAGTLRALLSSGRYQEVLDRHAARSAEWAGDPGAILAVATAATRLGRLHEGASLADGAIVAYRRRADDDGRMRCLNLLGAIAWENGALDAAADRWADALGLARLSGDATMAARAANNLASVMHLQGRNDESLSLYREALLAYQRLADRRGLAETEHNLALAHREAGDTAAAHAADDRAVRHAELVGDPVLRSLALAGRAETRLRQGESVLARRDVDQAEQLAVGANDRLGVADAKRIRAIGWIEAGDAEAAAREIEPARREAEAAGSALLQADCAAVAWRAFRSLGREAEAQVRLDEARRLYRRLGADAQLRRLDAS